MYTFKGNLLHQLILGNFEHNSIQDNLVNRIHHVDYRTYNYLIYMSILPFRSQNRNKTKYIEID